MIKQKAKQNKRNKVDSKRGVMYQIVLDSTFYPEGGGQVGDKGVSANETIKL
jgi:alanyl-tRNA synthetase